ncbi:MAG TPA: bifunctional UDP-sugar hydrolase/5'-nucleotidase [Syntrophobacteraceae bacterium]|nr:bifunctional UDP-sugar hydrolase/5'-nucleotidase [Syntrophobacteraceae bacterium]
MFAPLLGCCIAFPGPAREKTRPVRAVGLVLFSFLLLSLFPGVCGAEPVDLTILHVNDLHGHILPFTEKSVHEQEPVSGAAALAAMIQRERERNPEGTLLLSAGDMFQGAPISTVFHGKPVLEIMNHLRFDAMTLGNHEFDWGRDVLGELTTAARFPFLSANLKDREGRYLPGVMPYALFTRKGICTGVVGVTTRELAFRTKPSNVEDLTIEDPAAVLPSVLQEMKNRGAQLLVVLSHCGLQADMDLAVEVPGIHVIVGGDSHTVLPDPMKVGEALIVQAGYYGMYLGVLDLSFDPSTSRVARYTQKGELKPVLSGPDRPADPQVASMIREYETRFDARFNQAIGQTAVDLVRQRHAESNFGDLVTDVMREATGAQIAFQNGGGIRTDVYKGPITLGQLYSALPFDNYLVLMDLTGKQVLELLEQSAALAVQILQVSGLTVVYDLSRPPGNRVVEVMVGTRPLEEQAVYRVVTNDFLAAGGDRFTAFKEGKNVTARESLRDVVIDYVAKRSPIAPVTEGRITFKTP